MGLHWALFCPAVCLQECTLLSHLKLLPHISEFNRSYKCDWFCYQIFSFVPFWVLTLLILG
jgi:hypothetical protein